jgi:two-component system, NarL family, sensor histidine kinase BarA
MGKLREKAECPTRIIDWPLSVALVNKQSDLASDLLKMMYNDLNEWIQEITQAIQSHDDLLLRKHIHRLRGAACYCGLPNLKDHLCSMEYAIKNNHKELITSIGAELIDAMQDVIIIYERDYQDNADKN